MIGLAFKQLLNSGVRPVVRFTPDIEEIETGFESGMMGRATGYREDGDGCFEITFNFSEFESYNANFMKPVYYNKGGIPELKWNETSYYPEDCCESLYAHNDEEQYFEIVEEGKSLFNEYIASGSEKPYVIWLEELIQSYRD